MDSKRNKGKVTFTVTPDVHADMATLAGVMLANRASA